LDNRGSGLQKYRQTKEADGEAGEKKPRGKDSKNLNEKGGENVQKSGYGMEKTQKKTKKFRLRSQTEFASTAQK